MNNVPCSECGFDPSRVPTYDVTFMVPLTWQSGNTIGHGYGKKAWKYRKYREAFREKGRLQFLSVLKANKKRRLVLTRVIGKHGKKMDRWNLEAGGKPLIDVLVQEGLLVDDNPTWVESGPITQIKGDNDKHYVQVRLIEYEE